MSDVSIASSFVNMQDVAYISYSKSRGGIKTINFNRKPNSGKLWKEPSPYVKIAHPVGAQLPVEFYSPRYDQGDCGIEPGSDLRRLLYWNPSVRVGEDGMAHFDFYSSDARNTTYTILVEGINAGGELIRGTHRVEKK
jgi:hypothetical protein